MARIRIDIGQLAVAMDSGDGSVSWFLDRETGDVIPLNGYDRLEEDDQVWEAIDAGSERYVEIPSRSSREASRSWRISSLRSTNWLHAEGIDAEPVPFVDRSAGERPAS